MTVGIVARRAKLKYTKAKNTQSYPNTSIKTISNNTIPATSKMMTPIYRKCYPLFFVSLYTYAPYF
ncbi:MAG: hypothetical protein LBS73_00355 [Campylobacteraceae bacterium]|nr:hypothetical protein [Campylobacteraceae bacterium]